MKTIELNQYNTSLRLTGSESTRSITIHSVTVQTKPGASTSLLLTVLDEKDITIYTQVLDLSQVQQGETIPVDKRFVFYEHLTVQVSPEDAGSTYAVVLNFE